MDRANDFKAQLARPADLVGLVRYGFDGSMGGDFDVSESGPYIKLADVQAMLAGKSQPSHETIITEGDKLTCTACGTTTEVLLPLPVAYRARIQGTEEHSNIFHYQDAINIEASRATQYGWEPLFLKEPFK